MSLFGNSFRRSSQLCLHHRLHRALTLQFVFWAFLMCCISPALVATMHLRRLRSDAGGLLLRQGGCAYSSTSISFNRVAFHRQSGLHHTAAFRCSPAAQPTTQSEQAWQYPPHMWRSRQVPIPRPHAPTSRNKGARIFPLWSACSLELQIYVLFYNRCTFYISLTLVCPCAASTD